MLLPCSHNASFDYEDERYDMHTKPRLIVYLYFKVNSTTPDPKPVPDYPDPPPGLADDRYDDRFGLGTNINVVDRFNVHT